MWKTRTALKMSSQVFIRIKTRLWGSRCLWSNSVVVWNKFCRDSIFLTTLELGATLELKQSLKHVLRTAELDIINYHWRFRSVLDCSMADWNLGNCLNVIFRFEYQNISSRSFTYSSAMGFILYGNVVVEIQLEVLRNSLPSFDTSESDARDFF